MGEDSKGGVKLVTVSACCLLELLRMDYHVGNGIRHTLVANRLPPDAEVVGVDVHPFVHNIILKERSAKYPEPHPDGFIEHAPGVQWTTTRLPPP